MASLLLLPDEIKIKIFGYLDGIDKIEVLKVCRDFQRVGTDRSVLQCVNFAQNYRLTLPQLRYLARKQTANTVTHLNLNGIHWISSAQLRETIVKFTQLTALYVVDTQLSFRDLVRTLETTTEVRKLAFSLKPDSSGDVFVVKIPIPITHLYVAFRTRAFNVFVKLLLQFRSLEELWMIETKEHLVPYEPENTYLRELGNLPVVSSKLICLQTESEGVKIILQRLKDPETKWFNRIKLNNNSTLFIAEDINAPPTINHVLNTARRDKKKVTDNVDDDGLEFSFSDNMNAIDVLNYTKFKCCNFKRTDAATLFTNILNYKNTLAIRKMNCVSKMFWEGVEAPRRAASSGTSTEPLFKRRRIGLGAHTVDDNCKFAQFTKHVTEMEDFGLIDMEASGVHDKMWQINYLTFAQNWKILKKLTITSVNIHNGKFIIDITKNCTMLQCLKIHDNKVQDNLSSDLCEALQFATNLKDFRYERKGTIPVDQLFESLSKCSKLERVYIQCQNVSKISLKPIQSMLTNCENIIFLFILISSFSDSVCRSIKQSINNFGIKPQQIIFIRGRTYHLNNILYEDIPSCHVEEIVMQESDYNRNYTRSFFTC